MKLKTILTGGLLAFVVVSLGAAIADVTGLSFIDSDNRRPSPEPTGEKWVVYYFHSSHRCPTCRGIEANTRVAVGDQVDARQLELRVINYEEPAHRHLVNQFDLSFPTVILSLMRDGTTVRWKNLDRVWELCDDGPAFVNYVRSELVHFKEGQP